MPRLTSIFEAILQIGLASPLQSTNSTDLRLNHIQVIGSHNSYHREPSIYAKPFFDLLIPDPQDYYYSHASLPDQLDYQSVRSLELDVFADYSSPGQFANPLINRLAQLPAPSAQWQQQMREPGAKIMHVTDMDVGSVCPSLKACLAQLRAWSDQHPDHVPIIIDLEYKTVDARLSSIGGAAGEPWNATTLALLDSEIRTALGPDKLITPDDVRLRPGNAANLTLEQAVLQHGWPQLSTSRNKFLFVMDNNPTTDEGTTPLRDSYRANGHANLEHRAVFTNAVPGAADAAFLKRNDPTTDANVAEIADLVRKGYLVRTRADEPIGSVLGDEAEVEERLRRGLVSGAQVVSSDWVGVGVAARYGSDYVARLPGERGVPPPVVRCNPVSAPGFCEDAELEG